MQKKTLANHVKPLLTERLILTLLITRIKSCFFLMDYILWNKTCNLCNATRNYKDANLKIFLCYFRLIIEKEGPRALFKGLGPNIIGVAPSRAIYFCAYSQSKKTYNEIFPMESPVVHICSAATAGNVLKFDEYVDVLRIYNWHAFSHQKMKVWCLFLFRKHT